MYLCVLKLIKARCLCKSECYDGMEMNVTDSSFTFSSLNHSVMHMLNYYLELQWPYLEMNFLLCNPTTVEIPIKF